MGELRFRGRRAGTGLAQAISLSVMRLGLDYGTKSLDTVTGPASEETVWLSTTMGQAGRPGQKPSE